MRCQAWRNAAERGTFSEQRCALQGGLRPSYSEMKPPYTHVSRTALAVVAAAGSVWLSAFFLPGAGVQPIPLLPELGTAAGKVVAASLPHAKPKRTATTRPSNAAPAVARAPVAVTFAPQAARSRPKVRAVPTHRAHRQQPAAGPKRSAPVQAAAPAVATTASVTAASVSSAPAPRGRAVGWHRKHDHADAAAPTAPTGRHGHSHAKHGYGSPAQPGPAPAVAPAPAVPAAPPSVGGHDNGKHLGNGNGNQGRGPGGRP